MKNPNKGCFSVQKIQMRPDINLLSYAPFVPVTSSACKTGTSFGEGVVPSWPVGMRTAKNSFFTQYLKMKKMQK